MEGASSWREKMYSGAILAVFLVATILVSSKISDTQPDPYMDEVFHIPQAQQYCDGNFSEWDPMITTLPGLYLVSVVILKPVQLLLTTGKEGPSPVVTGDAAAFCSTHHLRSVNFIFAVGNLVLFYVIGNRLHGNKKATKHVPQLWLTAITLSLFPLLYFFTFLYYTDAGSTFFVLLMYLMHLHRHQILAAGAGSIGVLFRQTNIVWVIFVAGLSSIEVLRNFANAKDASSIHSKQLSDSSANANVQEEDSARLLKIAAIRFRDSFMHNRHVLKCLVMETCCQLLPYALVILSFSAFVIINGSIVVGAKNDHEAALHLPQVLYFSSFLVAFASVHVISRRTLSSGISQIWRRPFMTIVVATVCLVAVGNFTVAHRYLLADNRHYMFYLWNRIFRRHAFVKFALIPGYMFSAWAAWDTLERSLLWKLTYCICVAANLVPAPLIEFRYYILPYIIYRLNIPRVALSRLLAELAMYTVINAFTIYMFTERPFLWENDAKLQRFMW